MLNTCLLWLIAVSTSLFCSNLSAQVALTASGGDIQSNSGSVSFSAGQVAHTYHDNSSFRLGQGIQQAFELELLSYSNLDEDLLIAAFPNPTSNSLTISIPQKLLGSDIRLFSANGKLVQSFNAISEVVDLSLDHLPQGTYFIHLSADGSYPQVLKVIKT